VVHDKGAGHVDIRIGGAGWCGAVADDTPAPALWIKHGAAAPLRVDFRDELRSDAVKTIERLREFGFTTILLSGDRPGIVEETADELGVDGCAAGQKPDDKLRYLVELRDKGHKVLMVGDGLNDAPALAAGYVSMAPAAATDISRTAADLVYQGEELSPVVEALAVSKLADKLVKQNFGLALLYNLVAVPLAFAGMVTPLIAAVAMSSSSLLVSLNAFRVMIGAKAGQT
jgi:Cu2+-exporting ATPase